MISLAVPHPSQYLPGLGLSQALESGVNVKINMHVAMTVVMIFFSFRGAIKHSNFGSHRRLAHCLTPPSPAPMRSSVALQRCWHLS